MLAVLIYYRLRGLLNSVLNGHSKKRMSKRFALLGYLALPILLYMSIATFFSNVLASPLAGAAVVHMLLASSFLALLIFLLFSGLTVALHFYFLAKDYMLLGTAPLEQRTIYQYRFLETIFANSSVFWALGLPLIWGYGTAGHAPWWFYPLSLVASFFFISLPTGISGVFSLALIRILPAKQAKNMAALIVGMLFISLWIGFQFVRVSSLDPASSNFNPGALQQLGQTGYYMRYVPSEWLYRVLQGMVEQDWLQTWSYMGVLGLVFLAMYLLGMAFMGSNQTFLATQVAVKTTTLKSSGLPMPSSFTWALIVRDLKLLRRDSRQFTQVLMFVVIILVFPFLTKHNLSQQQGSMRMYLPFLYPLMLSSLSSSTSAARLIPLDGLSFSLFKCAPRRFARIVGSKNLLSILIGLVPGALAIVVSAKLFNIDRFTTLEGLAALTSLVLGATGIGSFFGAFFAKFDWEHPKRMLTGAGTFFMTVISIFYFLFMFGLLYVGHLMGMIIGGILLTTIVSFGMLMSGTILAAKKLDVMDWRF